MKFALSAAYLVALSIASPFLLDSAVASDPVNLKRRTLVRRRARGTRTSLPKNGAAGNAESSGTGTMLKRRRLAHDDDEDFYRYSCEFCGEENNSTLGLSPFDLGSGAACFSEDMKAEVLGSSLVSMKDLRVGDKVLTENGIYEPIYAFAHHAPDKEATFLQIHGDSGDPLLELTSDHLVFLANKKNPVLAKSVKVGDMLRSSNNEVAVTITKIGKVEKTGIYAPLTLGGSVVVNNVLASSYISLQDMRHAESVSQTQLSSEYMVIQGSKLQIPIMSHHQYVDMAIAPYRMACRVMGSALCDTTQGTSEGMPFYVKLGMLFNKMSAPHWYVHPLAMLVTIVATGPFWFFERAFFFNNGAINWAAMAVLLFATAGWITLKKSRVAFVTRKVKKA